LGSAEWLRDPGPRLRHLSTAFLHRRAMSTSDEDGFHSADEEKEKAGLLMPGASGGRQLMKAGPGPEPEPEPERERGPEREPGLEPEPEPEPQFDYSLELAEAVPPTAAEKLRAQRRELEDMPSSALVRMARSEGVDETLIDDAMDSENVDGELIEGILTQRSAGDRELRKLKVSELHKRASASGASEEAVASAWDSEDRKGALVALIMEQSEGGGTRSQSSGSLDSRSQTSQPLTPHTLLKMNKEQQQDDSGGWMLGGFGSPTASTGSVTGSASPLMGGRSVQRNGSVVHKSTTELGALTTSGQSQDLVGIGMTATDTDGDDSDEDDEGHEAEQQEAGLAEPLDSSSSSSTFKMDTCTLHVRGIPGVCLCPSLCTICACVLLIEVLVARSQMT
jgi:hypothetical protein